MENQNENAAQQGWELPPAVPKPENAPFFPTGAKELILALLTLIAGLLLCNSVLYGGFNLGFAIFAGLCLLFTAGYLLSSGCRLNGYSASLLALSLVILAGFARSDDGFVKFVLIFFLLISENLGLCLLAGQNRRSPAGLRSLLDAPRTLFMLGMGKLPEGFRGLGNAFRRSGSAAKKGGAVLAGLGIAIPLLAILIPLLVSADAAFDGLLQLLPEWDISELIVTLILGAFPVCVLYIRAVALKHNTKEDASPKAARKGISHLTVNTVLAAVCLVYAVYLVSQLAYFSGGFSGILPEGYSAAQYARRGFFEMAWLCAIDLAIMVLAVGLVAKQKQAPLSTRLLCLFIGLVTLFLVATSGAKMVLYIRTYALTQLRVLTSVIIFWLGLTTVLVSVWLFVQKLPYMKAVLLSALVLGAAVIWMDVDTVVARYNVNAYQSGALEAVDMRYLQQLGNSAVPYLKELAESEDSKVAESAATILESWYTDPIDDYRAWNFVDHQASKLLPAHVEAADTP